jgi:hypothetical protein
MGRTRGFPLSRPKPRDIVCCRAGDEIVAPVPLGWHEGGLFARTPHLGALGGFKPPGGRGFAVVGVAPEVNRLYHVPNPDLALHVRLTFPAFGCGGSSPSSPCMSEARPREPHAIPRHPCG